MPKKLKPAISKYWAYCYDISLNKTANDKFKHRLDKIKEEMDKRDIKYAEPSEMVDIWKSIKNK